jgi:flagella basal body P-ring formation protein FlgA
MKRSILILLVVVAVLLAKTFAHGAVVAKVILHPKSEVRSAQPITLGEIASVEAPQALAKKISGTVICTGPIPGNERIVDAEYVKAKLNALDLGCTIKVTGASAVLTGKCLRISSKQLEDEALNFVAAQAPSAEITYGATIQRSPREIVLPGGSNVEIQAKILSGSVKPGPNTIALEVITDGRVAATTSATVVVRAVADVLVATGAIPQGTAINDQNTKWDKRDLAGFSDPITKGQEDKNWVARRSIRAGSIINSSDVTLPPAVRAGDSVTLTVKCGGVSLTTTAEARQSGRIGESIRVRAGVSSEDVRARITSASAVEIVK